MMATVDYLVTVTVTEVGFLLCSATLQYDNTFIWQALRPN